MRSWVIVFCCNLFVPLLMIAFGRVMYKYPPKKINGIYGYRTSVSMKNKDTWEFAHKTCGKLWWKVGWIILLLSAAIQLMFIHSDDDTMAMLSLVLYAI